MSSIKKGSEIRIEDPLITLETDKASMDVPSPVSGVVESVEIKKGDAVVGRHVDRHGAGRDGGSGGSAAAAPRVHAAPLCSGSATPRLRRDTGGAGNRPGAAGGGQRRRRGGRRSGGARRRGGRLHGGVSGR